MILLVAEGPELRIVDVSRATRAMLGGREVTGLPLREALADLAGQGWVDLYEQVYRTGVPVTGQQWRAHITLPGGAVRELFADFSITPWRGEDGAVLGVVGGGTDVTAIVEARLSAERLAEDLQQQYRQARDVVDALQQALLPAACRCCRPPGSPPPTCSPGPGRRPAATGSTRYPPPPAPSPSSSATWSATASPRRA